MIRADTDVSLDRGHQKSFAGGYSNSVRNVSGTSGQNLRRELMRRANFFFRERQQTIEKVWEQSLKGKASRVTKAELVQAYRDLLPELVDMDGSEVDESSLRLLAALIQNLSRKVESGSVVTFGTFAQGAMLWMVADEQRGDWKRVLKEFSELNEQWEEAEDRQVNDVFALMEYLCPDATAKEAEVVRHLVFKIIEVHGDWDDAILLAIAYWVIVASPEHEECILREKLVVRLQLEDKLYWGLLHFLLLVTLFLAFMTSLFTAKQPRACNAIYTNLVAQYNLDAVVDVATISEIKDFLNGFSTASATMSPLSGKYFDAGGELQLLPSLHAFTAPRRLPETLEGKAAFRTRGAFTLQAWLKLTDVNVVPPAGGLPIFRRALSTTGAGSQLSCLSWNFPPALVFGAHDFAGVPSGADGLAQERVDAPYHADGSKYPEHSQMVLHSLVVDGASVRFYTNNATLVHSETLDRSMTNCRGGGATTLGSGGLTLATATYYPFALSPRKIDEVYKQGALLDRMGYMVQPSKIGELSEVDQLAAHLDLSTQAGAETAKRQTDRSEAVTALSTSMLQFTERDGGSAKWHDLSIDAQEDLDPVLGYPAMDMLGGPVEPDGTPSHLNSSADAAFPKIGAERGLTLSLWTKWRGNGYVISRAMPSCTGPDNCTWTGMRDMCWYLYLYPERVEVSLSSTQSSTRTTVVKDFRKAPPVERVGGATYRHVAMVVDPANATVPMRLCVDGVCEDSGFRLQNGSVADCEESAGLRERAGDLFDQSLNRAKVWISGRPPGNWPYTDEMVNLKVFDNVLSDAEVRRVFTEDVDPEEPGRTVRDVRGCRYPGEYTDDPGFVDEHGHDCFWYYKSRVHQGLRNCDFHRGAREKCQVACRVSDVCYGSWRDVPSVQLWNRQVEIRSKGTWGTMCIAQSTTAAKEAIKCGINAQDHRCAKLGVDVSHCGPVDCSQHEDDESALLSCLGDVTWTSINRQGPEFLPCKAILLAHSPSCAWDDSALEAVANASASNQEWSLQLWFEVLDNDGCGRPDVRLIDESGATFASVRSGLWLDEAMLDPPGGGICAPGTDSIQEVHVSVFGTRQLDNENLNDANLYDVPVPRPGEKHLLVFGRKASCGTGADAGIAAQLDNIRDVDCYPPADSAESVGGIGALRVINIMSNLRLSLMLSGAYPSSSDISLARYAGLESQMLRRGPDQPLEEQQSMRVERLASLFAEKSLLVAPPLLMQSRHAALQTCHWEFANDIILNFWEAGQRLHCEESASGLYSCSEFTERSIYECVGPDAVTEKEGMSFFGKLPQAFFGMSSRWYLELLSTITDFPVVVRDGRRHETNTFIDALTETVEVVSVFFSPQSGISTVLTVSFNFEKGGVDGSFEVKHLVPLMGEELHKFLAWMGLAIFLQLVEVYLLVIDVRRMLQKEDGRLHPQTLLTESIWGIMLMGGCVLSVWLLVTAIMSKQETKELLEVFTENWGSAEANLQPADKISKLVGGCEGLLYEAQAIQRLQSGTVALCFVIFSGILGRTHLHPRVALLTSTLSHAFSDMVHFLFMFSLVFGGLATIGTWLLGSTRKDMYPVSRALQTQLDALLDPPGSLALSDSKNFSYLVYVSFFHMITFFFMVNFFLAIIIEGYQKFKKHYSSTHVEYDLLKDTGLLLKKQFHSRYYGWRSSGGLALTLKKLPSTYVSVNQLKELTRYFPTENSARQFNRFYMCMDVLLQDATSQEASHHSLQDVEDRIVRRIVRSERSEHETIMTANERLAHRLLKQLPQLPQLPGDRVSTDLAAEGRGRRPSVESVGSVN